jgi:hypothetical protein
LTKIPVIHKLLEAYNARMSYANEEHVPEIEVLHFSKSASKAHYFAFQF